MLTNKSEVIIIHPGIDLNRICDIKSMGKIEANVATKIDNLLNELSTIDLITNDKRNKEIDLLNKILELALNYKVEYFSEFKWFIEFTSCLVLLKHIPPPVRSTIQHLFLKILELECKSYESDPVKIHMVAKLLYNTINDMENIIFLIRLMCNSNRFMFYVSVTLVWALIRQMVNLESTMFRMYEVNELITILQNINLENYSENLKEFYRFLSLLSLFQNLIILNRPKFMEYICFKDFFLVTDIHFDTFYNWLKETSKFCENLFTKNKNRQDFIEIRELITLDMLHLMEENKQRISQ